VAVVVVVAAAVEAGVGAGGDDVDVGGVAAGSVEHTGPTSKEGSRAAAYRLAFVAAADVAAAAAMKVGSSAEHQRDSHTRPLTAPADSHY